ncbi:MAG TPA: hypothetical protein VD971_03140 [Phycisphaerales bacterium]|nr:hypothetical protein [Phycisphaerales bacterium]
MALPAVISGLRDAIGAVRSVPRCASVAAPVGTLRCGAVHEWFGEGDRRGWSPPLVVLADTARRTAEAGGLTRIVWVGRSCWPCPLFLDRCRSVLDNSIFLDPPDDASRLWCIDAAARCGHPTLVVGDGQRCTLAHTRRLQLAAGAGSGLCLLARPACEAKELSAAVTRWMVARAPSLSERPRWTVTLLRDKDRPVRMDEHPVTTVEWDDAAGGLCVPAPVADRAIASPVRPARAS